ncbi:xanthine dehydrogenase family protein molybdopterin-binding subunit [Lichenibacterium dinghuense]|uniref:xanthine dehydrogenase family protein molybdopterin-binding subunit n=1 Tax=Lichenibacterium dinghuense TaxID=2895977 RepID=UPI001F344D40|nr:xanthine dehydrogenase family protein molybdopterin-binding subunit [Lichenibacterium sp. 6Y81]
MNAPTSVGQPLRRVDGRAKVTGAARYASDLPLPGLAHAALATSRVARGRIVSIDAREAEAVPGVLGVFTHREFGGAVRPVGYVMGDGYVNSTFRPLDGPEIRYHGQIIGLAVAETQEAAEEAAALIRFTVDEAPAEPRMDLASEAPEPLAKLSAKHHDIALGDADAALARSNIGVDGRYSTPIQHHNPIELFSTACAWDGDRLTVHEASKYIDAVQHGLAAQLGLDPADVRVVCPFIGGHFGSKFGLSQHTAIVALAARRLGRPVSLVPSRRDCFTIANHRPETRHRVALAADADGRLRGLIHEAAMATSRFDDFAMEGTDVTAAVYACPAIRTREEVLRVDRNTPGPMRAPPEVPYVFALESAMDELATRLDLDPIELRRRNETRVRPEDGKPFSTHPLMRCFAVGAAAFGWDRRRPSPGSLRDGDWLVGLGCASTVRPVKTAPACVRVAVEADGSAVLETAHHEIGQGLYTILTQLAADGLGLAPERVTVRLGDTDFPPAAVSGGSSTTTGLAPAVEAACDAMRLALGRLAAAGAGPLAGADPATLRLGDGALTAPDGRSEPLAVLAAAAPGGRVAVLHEHLPEGMKPAMMENLKAGKTALGQPSALAWAFGAQFAEVRVHAVTGEIRVAKLLGAFAGGRILNPRLARDQLIGGMVGGLGSALLEATVADARTGAYVNRDLAEYHVPVSADVVEVEAILVEDDDPAANEAGVKGIGELGIIGVNAAVANAVFNATGDRHRDLPIRLGDRPR